MKARVSGELCDGCGTCAEICPEVFEVRDGIAVVKGDTVPDDSEECAKEAQAACAPEAISVS